jgi:hypothetical protein
MDCRQMAGLGGRHTWLLEGVDSLALGDGLTTILAANGSEAAGTFRKTALEPKPRLQVLPPATTWRPT